eukprot:scpid15647/ scgid8393/ 
MVCVAASCRLQVRTRAHQRYVQLSARICHDLKIKTREGETRRAHCGTVQSAVERHGSLWHRRIAESSTRLSCAPLTGLWLWSLISAPSCIVVQCRAVSTDSFIFCCACGFSVVVSWSQS